MTPSKGRRPRFRQTSDHSRPGTGSGKGCAAVLEAPAASHPMAASGSEAQAHYGPKVTQVLGSPASHRPARRTSRRADEAGGSRWRRHPVGVSDTGRLEAGDPEKLRPSARIDTGQTGAPTGARIHLATSRSAQASPSGPGPASVRRQPGVAARAVRRRRPRGRGGRSASGSERASDELDLPVVDRVVDVALEIGDTGPAEGPRGVRGCR